MSRTFKDAPGWVQGARARNRRISHNWFCEESDHPFSNYPHYLKNLHPCNIDDPRSRSYGAGHKDLCSWDFPVWDRRGWYAYGFVPHWYINHRWNAPSRLEERTKFGEAVKQYRATGEIDDIVFEHNYHRHTSRRDYW